MITKTRTEYFPFVRRWEYSVGRGWEYIRLPLNKGATRDIPPGALLHHSVIERLQYFPDGYHPKNDASVPTRSWHLHKTAPRAVEYGGSPPKQGPYFVSHNNQDTVEETDRIYGLDYK